MSIINVCVSRISLEPSGSKKYSCEIIEIKLTKTQKVSSLALCSFQFGVFFSILVK